VNKKLEKTLLKRLKLINNKRRVESYMTVTA